MEKIIFPEQEYIEITDPPLTEKGDISIKDLYKEEEEE